MDCLRSFSGFLKDFRDNRRGTTAILFGIVVIPLLALAGGAVDYSRAVKTKAQLSATLDAAVLAAMLQYANDNSVDYHAIIENYVHKNLDQAGKPYHGMGVTINDAHITADGELVAEISSKVKTYFVSLVGFDEFDVHVKSGAKVGGSKLELALVLDTTASMQGTKLENLKSSAKNLIDIIYPADLDNSNGQIKISVVPFSAYVNIGMENRNEPGLDIPDDYEYTEPGTHTYCPDPEVNQTCQDVEHSATCYDDSGNPYDCSWTGHECTCAVDEVEEPNEPETFAWHGCMGSRNPGDPRPTGEGDTANGLNVKDEGYDTGVPGLMTTWNICWGISPITRLTNDRQTVIDAIDALEADRDTYIPAGLAWGWRLLSNEAPFSDGRPYSDLSVRKVIVLMTDGSNTLTVNHWEKSWDWGAAKHNAGEVWAHNNQWSPDNPEVKTEADNFTRALCTNIKAKGIMIYTIGFGISDNDTKNMLQACAGNGGQYYDAADSTELADAFRHIGQSLLNLRLSS